MRGIRCATDCNPVAVRNSQAPRPMIYRRERLGTTTHPLNYWPRKRSAFK